MFYKYERLRATLIYLGYPRTEDPLYAHWENSRLFLKGIFGAPPDHDLFQMKPTSEQCEVGKCRKLVRVFAFLLSRGFFLVSSEPTLISCYPLSHTHTHTHTHTSFQTHAQTHTHTESNRLTCILSHTSISLQCLCLQEN